MIAPTALAAVDHEARPTPQQRAVLAMLATGEGREYAARRLRISVRTVDLRLGEAVRLLGAANLTHAVALAVARGFVLESDINAARRIAPSYTPAHSVRRITRLAIFAEQRRKGVPIPEAARRAGVSRTHGYVYERARTEAR